MPVKDNHCCDFTTILLFGVDVEFIKDWLEDSGPRFSFSLDVEHEHIKPSSCAEETRTRALIAFHLRT